MKKLAPLFVVLLVLLSLAYPLSSIIAGLNGYELVLTWPMLTLAVITLLSLLLAIPLIGGGKSESWFSTILCFFLPAIAALNLLLLLVAAPSVLSAILAFLCMAIIALAAIMNRHGVVSAILITVLALLPAGIVGAISYTAITKPETLEASTFETILEVESPDGSYTAIVKRTASENAVEGNDTFISVADNTEAPIDFFIGKLQRSDEHIHLMNWNNFELSSLKWIDESTLLCDGAHYSVTDEGVIMLESALETESPAVEATEAPAVEATEAPVVEATEAPAVEATEAPVVEIVEAPAAEATEAPAENAGAAPAEDASGAPAVEPEVAA